MMYTDKFRFMKVEQKQKRDSIYLLCKRDAAVNNHAVPLYSCTVSCGGVRVFGQGCTTKKV